jgi:tRNA nucleotidyltransferase/poly(A) polymerase
MAGPPPPGGVRLRPELAARVAVVARTAARLGIEVYLVGGTVRDLLLGRDSPDLDFVAVGDGLALARAVERELGGRLVSHPSFLTADVVDAEGVNLDIATARAATYRDLAALPEVRPASRLADDLVRRDFTVNAMALRLRDPCARRMPAGGSSGGVGGAVSTAGCSHGDHDASAVTTCDSEAAGAEAGGPPGEGQASESGEYVGDVVGRRGQTAAIGSVDLDDLVDPHGGRRDLAAGVLRPLHDRSFLDDPTRVMRGLRFEVRLGLRLAPEAESMARRAVAAGAFARLSGSRWRHELELLLGAEPVPAVALVGLARLAELDALAAVHPRLAPDEAAWRRIRDAAMEHAWYHAAGRPEPPVRLWLLLLMAVTAALPANDRREIAERLLLAGGDLRLVSGFVERLAAALAQLGSGAAAHEADAALAGLGGEELLLLAAEGGTLARSWVRRYLTELRPLRLGVRGADLVAAGARPSPAIGRALDAVRAARLDGVIGPTEELDYALARLAADENL